MEGFFGTLRGNRFRKLSALLCAAFSLVFLFGGCESQPSAEREPTYITGDTVPEESGDSAPDEADPDETEGSEKLDGLVIPLSELTTDAGFYGTTVDGTYIEVIAFLSGSSYRTALNTCQICYGSDRAYFVQTQSYLQCRNCGSKFKLTQVGISVSPNTCSPYPVLETDRTMTEDSIVIPYEFLEACKSMFETWKVR